MKIAILIHNIDWLLKEAEYVINDNIRLCKSEGSQVNKCYANQCEKYMIDDGEPLTIGSHFEIDLTNSDEDETLPYWHTAHSIISRVCNLISILSTQPICSYRVLIK